MDTVVLVKLSKIPRLANKKIANRSRNFFSFASYGLGCTQTMASYWKCSLTNLGTQVMTAVLPAGVLGVWGASRSLERVASMCKGIGLGEVVADSAVTVLE